jgi:DNA topoisomerase-6 subunit B
MTSEYTLTMNKDSRNSIPQEQPHLVAKVLKPALTAYSSRTCVINNRPTVVECGIAYGGDIGSFKLYRFANKIPLLYDEGSDVAREVVSEVEINRMGITKKEVKEQFSTGDSKSDRAVELLPLHIFFHICSTKIPYKTAGKESIAAEGDLKKYMKSCLADLYRKVSAQIRKELRVKDAENRLRLYRHYIPFIIEAISESIDVDAKKLYELFNKLAERHVRGDALPTKPTYVEDTITEDRIQQEVGKDTMNLSKTSISLSEEITLRDEDKYLQSNASALRTRKKSSHIGMKKNEELESLEDVTRSKSKKKKGNSIHTQITLDKFDKSSTSRKARRS